MTSQLLLPPNPFTRPVSAKVFLTGDWCAPVGSGVASGIAGTTGGADVVAVAGAVEDVVCC
ncbi:hypothetical protein F2Q70_00030908 [Brassica cretica]|uniref:Uncharacterized protein n=1 Tax=Brassica cretica TaxID=69181 RepID=A0A8S9FCH3_BRACR|nr:hypothetical protein F2Q70_00030908 [Brassica cretica]